MDVGSRCNALNYLTFAFHAASSLILPLYAVAVGASPAVVGLIGAIYGFSSFAASWVFGHAGDRFDRRRVLMAGFAVAVVGFSLQLVAFDPWSLMAARFVAGVAFGAIPATLAAYVYELKRPLGKFSSYNALGWLTGSLFIVAMGLLEMWGFRAAPLTLVRDFLIGTMGPLRSLFLFSAVLAVLGIAIVRRLPSMRAEIAGPIVTWRLVRRNANVYLPVLVRHVGATGVWIVYPLYIVSLGGDLAMVGWITVTNMVAQVVVLRNAERFRRIGSGRVLFGAGLLLSAVTLYSFTLVTTAVQLVPLQVLLGVSFGSLWLGSLKLVMEQNTERATASGLLNGSFNLSQVGGPFLGGLVAEAYGFKAAILWGAFLSLAAFILYLAWPQPARAPGPADGPREPMVAQP